jgi:hypothetical protein
VSSGAVSKRDNAELRALLDGHDWRSSEDS